MTINRDGYTIRRDTRHGVLTDWSYLQQLEDEWRWTPASNDATVLSQPVAECIEKYLRAAGMTVRVRPDALRRAPSVTAIPEQFSLAA